jgi:aminodeoxyfutalosine deaminase
VRFLRGDKLFNGQTYLAEDRVLVLDDQNVLKEIISENEIEKNKIEVFKGTITPGFINAHCHLELSHLKGKISQHTGLPSFAQQVVGSRNSFTKNEISQFSQQADQHMQNNGIVAVGDISNTSDSFEIKQNSKLYYHTFVELIGLNPINAPLILEKGKVLLESLLHLKLPGSLAPHAPYSTSVELIQLIAKHNQTSNTSLSIHNQESEEESKFFEGTPNGFDVLYKSLGLDLSWYKAPGGSSIAHYAKVLSKEPSILVHNTFTTLQDLKATQDKNVYWCFCPGANVYIENRLPDFSVFTDQKNKICIGTDSLASNSQLNVVAEANLILNHTKEFSIETILQALTYNGAAALNSSDKFGSFILDKNAGLNLVDFNNSEINFIKKIA